MTKDESRELKQRFLTHRKDFPICVELGERLLEFLETGLVPTTVQISPDKFYILKEESDEWKRRNLPPLFNLELKVEVNNCFAIKVI